MNVGTGHRFSSSEDWRLKSLKNTNGASGVSGTMTQPGSHDTDGISEERRRDGGRKRIYTNPLEGWGPKFGEQHKHTDP